MRLRDKVAIVTGGASGIGRAAALLFAKQGASVAIGDVQVAAGKDVVACIEAGAGRALFVRTDVSQENDVGALVDETMAAWDGVDVLFSNAGIGLSKNVTDTSVQEWRHVLDVNLQGAFLCARAVIPVMKARGGGSIVINASANGLLAEPDLAAYCASKGGLIALTRSMALDYGKDNIRVNCICAGYIDTPINEEYFALPGAREQAARLHALGRIGQPQEVAYAALFLASQEASFITGSVLAVDGGLTTAITGSV
jgi:NAD(P)-dependent dehydrogenase (short-subunit alcohol dehydrogenase family)